MAGHVFIVRGDLRKIACDAFLISCSRSTRPGNEWFLPGYDGPRRGERFAESGRRVQPLQDAAPDLPRPWLAQVGARDKPVSWYGDGAIEFLEAAAGAIVEVGTPPLFGRAKSLLALPIVGTGLGGAAAVAGEIVQEFLPRLEEFASRSFPGNRSFDVALVCWDAATPRTRREYRERDSGDPRISSALCPGPFPPRGFARSRSDHHELRPPVRGRLEAIGPERAFGAARRDSAEHATLAPQDARLRLRPRADRAHAIELHPIRRTSSRPDGNGPGVPRHPARTVRRVLARRRQLSPHRGCRSPPAPLGRLARSVRHGPDAREWRSRRGAVGTRSGTRPYGRTEGKEPAFRPRKRRVAWKSSSIIWCHGPATRPTCSWANGSTHFFRPANGCCGMRWHASWRM